jgi:hypothetical protein
MSKHTAGPWNVIYKFGTSVGISSGKPQQYVNGEAQDQIVMIVPCAEHNGGDEATKANAHLIAAAPDLLEALESIVFKDREAFDEDGWARVSFSAITKCADAIAKARGEA